MSSVRRLSCAILVSSAFALLSSCSSVSPVAVTSPTGNLSLKGVVRGGQQPVTGATIQLYSVGTAGDGSAATALITSTVQTDQSGNFSISSQYNCPTQTTEVYLVATGGNPGLTAGTNNAAIAMMAALGQCGTLSSSSFIFVDEVTTIGSVAALYPYMSSYSALGSGSGDAAAFATALGNVTEYTNTATGTAPGPNLPSGYYASSTEIDTLGNIVASCINSTGGVAGDGSACGDLFNLTKSGGVAPTNTIGAILNILNNPTQNVSSLFSLGSAVTPFQPSLSVAPTTWALPIETIAAAPTFSIPGGTFSSAQSVTISDTTPGATIYYTTDGSIPTSASPIYSTAITVSSSETLQAIAQAGGYATSAVTTGTYTINGSTPTYSIGGQVNLVNNCGGVSIPAITLTLSQSTTIVQSTSTGSGSGDFSLSNIPNGTYTLTPSITGPSSIFYPASQTVVVNSGNINSVSFSTTLGYTVSGTVAYNGSQTGRTYISLNPTNCGGGGTQGTSISNTGAFSIRGVPPGAYTLQAFMDNLGNGAANASNPSGNSSVSVANANYTGANVTLADPTTVTLASAPTINGVAAISNGAIAQFQAITNSNGVEMPTSYTMQWSTTSTFNAITGSRTFPAIGTRTDAWFMNNSSEPTLTNGSAYYFRAYGTSAGTAASPYSNVIGPITIQAPTGGNTVSGAITFAATPTGPLYIGFLDQNTDNIYGEYIANPVSSQAYSIQVPTGSNYLFVGILDQNSDGVVDAGDDTDVNGNGGATVISGPTSNENLALPSANSTATVTTQNNLTTISGNTSQTYGLYFQVNEQIKLPVAVTLASGPNVISPVDISVCGGSGSSCGQGFQISSSIFTDVPNVGDTYTFDVTYSDGTTGIITASVTAVLNAFATNLSPQTGTSSSTTPTFTWTDPTNAGNYTYSFNLCCSNNSNIWQIPGNNSNSNGFTSSTTSLTWGIDPTGGGSTPTLGSLVNGTNYSWLIQVQDSNGNTAQTQVQYQP